MRTIPRAGDLLTSGLFTGGLLTTCGVQNISPATTANASLSCAECDETGGEAQCSSPAKYGDMRSRWQSASPRSRPFNPDVAGNHDV